MNQFNEINQEGINLAKDWAKRFPYPQLVKRFGLPPTRKLDEKVKQLFTFFDISSPEDWENNYTQEEKKSKSFINLSHTQEPEIISAWLRQGELQIQKIPTPPFQAKVFEEALQTAKSIMALHPNHFFQELQECCLEAGVVVIFTPQLPKAPISGSSRWINNTPLIQLSARYKQNDRFWFAFFQAAGHILLHDQNYISLKNVNYSDADYQKERKAHHFAEQWTFSQQQELEVRRCGVLSTEDILDFSVKFNTHPALIIGRFHHKRLLPFTAGREFIVPIDLEEDQKQSEE